MFIDMGYVLIPLGFAAWIAFTLGMIMINGSYIISMISDPFGWGWDLFGTANFAWRPLWPEAVSYIESIIVLIGGFLATVTGWKVSLENFGREKAIAGMIPICLVITILMGVFIYIFTGGL